MFSSFWCHFFFVSVVFFFLFVSLPSPPNIQRHIPVNFGGCFQKSSIFTWSQKSNTHKLRKTFTVSVLAWARFNQSFWNSKVLTFRIFKFVMKHLKVPTVQKWHAGNVNLQQVFGCLDLSLVASHRYVSLSPDFCLHPTMKHGQTKKKQKNTEDGSIQGFKNAPGEKINKHVAIGPYLAFSIAAMCPATNDTYMV